jgi:hypothetical protein
VCGTVTALVGGASVDTLVERCGASLDTRGVRWDDGLRELVFGWHEPPGAVMVLSPTATLYFLEGAGPSWSTGQVLAFGTVTDRSGVLTTVPLSTASLHQESDTRWRWNLLFEAAGSRLTLDGDDEVDFAMGAPGDEPLARPAGADAGVDAGVAVDGGVDAGVTACGLEFGLPPTPQTARPPGLVLLSREPAADPLCGQGLAWLALVDLSGSSLGSLARVQAAEPGHALAATPFAADGASATVLICSSLTRPRLFVRLDDGVSAADLCGDTHSLSQPTCPFATTLPPPSAGFTPPFTHSTATTLALCPRGLEVSFGFMTDVRVSGWTLEQPVARLSQGGAIGSTGTWTFDACLSPPNLSAFALQLTTTSGLRSDVHCEAL